MCTLHFLLTLYVLRYLLKQYHYIVEASWLVWLYYVVNVSHLAVIMEALIA